MFWRKGFKFSDVLLQRGRIFDSQKWYLVTVVEGMSQITNFIPHELYGDPTMYTSSKDV